MFLRVYNFDVCMPFAMVALMLQRFHAFTIVKSACLYLYVSRLSYNSVQYVLGINIFELCELNVSFQAFMYLCFHTLRRYALAVGA